MTPLELTTFVTALANAISCNVKENDSVALLGTVFAQLGDTLATISAQRSILASKKESL